MSISYNTIAPEKNPIAPTTRATAPLSRNQLWLKKIHLWRYITCTKETWHPTLDCPRCTRRLCLAQIVRKWRRQCWRKLTTLTAVTYGSPLIVTASATKGEPYVQGEFFWSRQAVTRALRKTSGEWIQTNIWSGLHGNLPSCCERYNDSDRFGYAKCSTRTGSVKQLMWK